MEIKKIKETCLYVSDLLKTCEFYHHKLGLPLINLTEDRHVFFRAGSSVLLCFIAEVTKHETTLPPHYGSGHLHIAFEVAPDEYDAWKEKIERLEIPIIHEQSWSRNLKSFYFKDPDEHLLEIVQTGMWE